MQKRMITDRSDWAFGDFWRALNSHLACLGLPGLTFRDAHEMWTNARETAERRAYESTRTREKAAGV